MRFFSIYYGIFGISLGSFIFNTKIGLFLEITRRIFNNGEAPAFVVTVSGKKIANQNLKSGVYFVVVDGETVKVSVQ